MDDLKNDDWRRRTIEEDAAAWHLTLLGIAAAVAAVAGFLGLAAYLVWGHL